MLPRGDLSVGLPLYEVEGIFGCLGCYCALTLVQTGPVYPSRMLYMLILSLLDHQIINVNNIKAGQLSIERERKITIKRLEPDGIREVNQPDRRGQ